ncbi:MAG TPA: hypothetical protein VHZ25_11020 [Acidobacteriaceae bacterium]|nr:hypothetical protein [Acidobacteriaceae bacterium]
MTKALRVAVLSSVLALCAAPVFADPGGSDPPPPPLGGSHASTATTAATLAAVLAALGS